MERLTESRGDRAWKLFHIGWYINLILVIVVLLFAAWYFADAQGEAEETEASRSIIMMCTMMIVASLLLMGAGVSRYEARLEGQHLELKLAIKETGAQIEELRREERKGKSRSDAGGDWLRHSGGGA